MRLEKHQPGSCTVDFVLATTTVLLCLCLTCFLSKPLAETFRAWMLPMNRGVLFCDVVRLGKGVVAHCVFGVFETAALVIDVLGDAHCDLLGIFQLSKNL